MADSHAMDLNDFQLIKQGAEAKLYAGTFYDKPTIIKERFKKGYRHPSLDQTLTTQRTKSEVRSMLRCRMNGVSTPAVYFVDLEAHKIYMEHVTDGKTVRDYIRELTALQDADRQPLMRSLAEQIGTVIGTMHDRNIIHGDLTTSNMLLRDHGKGALVMIDFGLGHIENVAEDKGVDLYVLERALLSTHPNTEWVFAIILDAYKKTGGPGVAEVVKKFEEVRLRGRKRTMVG